MNLKLLGILVLLTAVPAWAGPKPIIIGVSGGSASGKTTLAKRLYETLNVEGVAKDQILLISQDNYFNPQQQPKEFQMPTHPNFDHPTAMDFDLMRKHLAMLRNGQSIDLPDYDWVTNTRKPHGTKVDPAKVIIFEGIHALHDETLRDQMDLKVFVQFPADLRLIRRIKRDFKDRAKTADETIHWYLTMVRPMHDKFIEPTAAYADAVFQGDANMEGAQEIAERVMAALALEGCSESLTTSEAK